MTRCPYCSGTNLVQIDLAPAGRLVRFATCRSCEHRWWMDTLGAGELTLDDVLTAVSSR